MSNKPSTLLLNCKRLGRPNSLEQLLDVVLDMRFKLKSLIVGSYVEGLHASWQEYDEQARCELHIAYDKGELSFIAVDKESHLILQFDLDWERLDSGQLRRARVNVISSDTVMFTQKKFDREYYAQRFLELGERLYGVVQPTFGWIERCRASGYTKLGDVANLALPHIYWANFFGPDYVSKLGKDYLLNAPGWETKELEDGGCLYVLSPSLAGTGPRALVEQVKQYFTVDSVRRK